MLGACLVYNSEWGCCVMSPAYLFLDMNAYFASVEQQEQPELRGQPVAIVAVNTDTTCCIAASYEAKTFGVKTGTFVRDAKRMCPILRIVTARPAVYVQYHHHIIAAVEQCLPVVGIHSIDEMSCRLIGDERQPHRAAKLAQQIKQSIYKNVGECLRCSVGIAPSRFLAKVAADMQKPDGLTIITRDQLPERLYGLKLSDLPGIGSQMLKRLHKYGIDTIQQLCALSEQELVTIWHSVNGELWYRWLRGEDVPDMVTHRRTVGHSHVLPPEERNDAGAYAVMSRMIHKAAFRLRQLNYWAKQMRIDIYYLYRPPWSDHARLGLCQDTLTMLEACDKLWGHRPSDPPYKLGVTLYDLVPDSCAPQPLFPEERNRIQLSRAMDMVNLKFGPHTVYFAGMYGAQESAPMRISYTCIPDLDFQP